VPRKIEIGAKYINLSGRKYEIVTSICGKTTAGYRRRRITGSISR